MPSEGAPVGAGFAWLSLEKPSYLSPEAKFQKSCYLFFWH